MSGPRVQVETKIEKEAIQPQAAPVDTFVRAGVNPLQQLAEGLAAVAPAGRDLAMLLQERESKAEFEAGRQTVEGLREEAASYQDAIKKGLIDPSESPWFRRGAEEQFGRLAADSFGSQLAHNALLELQDSTDPEDFEKFAAEQRSAFFETLGEDGEGAAFLAGFSPRADAHFQNARNSFNAQAGARLVAQVNQQTYQEHMNTIQQGIDLELDLEVIAEGINLTNDRGFATGLAGRAANELSIQAVVDAAESIGDERVLDLLQHVRGGPGGTLENHSKAQQLVEAARARIAGNQQQKLRWEWTQQDRERNENGRAIVAGAVTQMLDAQNPYAFDMAAVQQQLIENGTPDLAISMGQYRSSIANGTLTSNPGQLNSVIQSIYSVTDPNDFNYITVERLVDMDLTLPEFEKALTHVARRDSDGTTDSAQRSFNLSQLRSAQSRLRSQFVSQFGLFNEHRVDAAAAAEAELADMFWSEVETNPNMSMRQLNTWFTETSQGLVEQRRQELPMYTEPVEGEEITPPLVGPRREWHTKSLITEAQFGEIEQAFTAAGDNLADVPQEVLGLLISLGVQTASDVQEFMIAQRYFHP